MAVTGSFRAVGWTVIRERSHQPSALPGGSQGAGRAFHQGPLDVREHRGGLVDSRHAVAERGELARDPPGAGAQLQHGGRRRQRLRDAVAFAERRQHRVQLDRAAVGRDGHPDER
jgi:hypothetical protein